jgi:hypothetical protein
MLRDLNSFKSSIIFMTLRPSTLTATTHENLPQAAAIFTPTISLVSSHSTPFTEGIHVTVMHHVKGTVHKDTNNLFVIIEQL